jgi:hypothetical protein
VQPLGKGHCPLGVTGGAKVPPLAGVSQQVLVSAVPAADPSEPQFQVDAAEILENRLAGDWAEVPLPVLVAFGKDLFEALVVLLNNAVIRALLWATRAVDSLISEHEYSVSDIGGRVDFNTLAPYLGIGYGNTVQANGH